MKRYVKCSATSNSIEFEGNTWFKTDSQFQDAATGKPLTTYYRIDERNNTQYLIRNLDGSLELE